MDSSESLNARLAGRIERHVPLAPLTTFRIGGPADLFFRARTSDDLALAVRSARALEIPYFVLGAGANVLVGDRGFRGLVIRSEVAGIEFLDEHLVRAGAGVLTFPDLIEATVSRGLAGLHHYVGIPSTVGGAIWQNLHFLSPPPARQRTCFIEEVFESCEVLTDTGERVTLLRDDLRFGYDYSVLHERDHIVLNATFRLEPEDGEQLRYVMRENLKWRAARHPDLWLYPCAGSIFKKLDGIGAGRLIDACGLKGVMHGNAQIFEGHANIIVNLGGATASDVRALIELARDSVASQLGYELEPEIAFVGSF